MNIKVQIKGLAELQRNLSRYPSISKPEFNKAIEKSLKDIQANAVPLTPVKTSRLRGSYSSVTRDMYGEVGPDAYYGIYVHEGTYKMRSRPFLANALQNSQSVIDKNFGEALDNINKKIAKI